MAAIYDKLYVSGAIVLMSVLRWYLATAHMSLSLPYPFGRRHIDDH